MAVQLIAVSPCPACSPHIYYLLPLKDGRGVIVEVHDGELGEVGFLTTDEDGKD
jgi:hypothetical protein